MMGGRGCRAGEQEMFVISPWGCGDGGTAPGLTQSLTGHPSAPSGEEEINVSCQAESYNGSFHCSWPGPPSAVFHARLIRR